MHPFLAPLSQDEVPEDVKALYSDYEAHLGAVPPLVKILARRPAYAQLLMSLRMAEKSASDATTTADHLLIGARIAALAHSPYSMRGIVERNSMYGALHESKLESIFHGRIDAETFDTHELLMLDIAEKVYGGSMDQKTWDHIREIMGDTDALDLMVIACNQQWIATISRALGLTSADMVDMPEGPLQI